MSTQQQLDIEKLASYDPSFRPQEPREKYVVYRYRGDKTRATAGGAKEGQVTLTFVPDSFGGPNRQHWPIRKVSSDLADALAKANRALVALDIPIGTKLLHEAITLRENSNSAEAIADAWENVFGDKVPTLAAHANEEQQRATAIRRIRKELGFSLTDAESAKYDLKFLKEVLATKGMALHNRRMTETAITDSPSQESALADPERPATGLDKEGLKDILVALAKEHGERLESGIGKDIPPSAGRKWLLDKIARYDQEVARLHGWEVK